MRFLGFLFKILSVHNGKIYFICSMVLLPLDIGLLKSVCVNNVDSNQTKVFSPVCLNPKGV